MPGQAIRLKGIVQGVGFRPFIWHLAKQYHLSGSVWNDEQGVMIHVWGESSQIQAFIRNIPQQLPPLAKLEHLEIHQLDKPSPVEPGFNIVPSQQDHSALTWVSADAATCSACLAEINDPNNRRFAYPFTNCTHCGPRFSIISAIPYDRCNTSMAEFSMCTLCQQEYDNPADRRFHAQANCCPDCGPRLWLEDNHDHERSTTEVLKKTAELIKKGCIVAIKGLGGFHLACDATNEQAVATLRQRKGRYAKPFALMARDLGMIARYVRLGVYEKQILLDKSGPIVIMPALGEWLAPSVAMNNQELGFMLPYTPLHYLLMQNCQQPIVMTSGNHSDLPQCIDNDEAKQKLNQIADYFLLHDRAIVSRLDDSVIRIMAGKSRMMRRARGFAPKTMTLPAGFETSANILAMGAELKNSFCLVKKGQAIVSQYIGDLEDAATQNDYRNNIVFYKQMFGFEPECIAVDLHQGYMSTQYGQQWAMEEKLKLKPIQHHHAHIAACLVEHCVALKSAPVLGVVFDGLGMGLQDQLWGGEFFLANYHRFTRLANMQPIAMPGGTQAIREPWRNAFAQLNYYFDWQQLQQQFAGLDIIDFLQSKPLETLASMITHGVNSPLSSSCGRWFDSFAALLGLSTEQIKYEGQAAIELESLATPVFSKLQFDESDDFKFEQQGNEQVISWKQLYENVLNDLHDDVDRAIIAARIHHSLANATVKMVLKLSRQTEIDTVVLSGGVFQNQLLLESMTRQLEEQGKVVLSAKQYPMNDGGLALGQAVIAAAEMAEK